ncbi:hypothetical protein NHX12_000770, partial [Muraenolepis orangiensis]
SSLSRRPRNHGDKPPPPPSLQLSPLVTVHPVSGTGAQSNTQGPRRGMCFPCTGSSCPLMGQSAGKFNMSSVNPGTKFFLTTGQDSPFGRYSYKVKVLLEGSVWPNPGYMSVALKGARVQTLEYQLHNGILSPGAIYEVFIHSEVDVGEVKEMIFKWNNYIFNPLKPKYSASKIELVRGKDNKILERITDDDFRKADEFIKLMRILYTSTLAVSSENMPTCGQILPILKKLEAHFTVTDGDSSFAASIKEKIWTDLSKRYQDDEISAFLEEATIMDPRFKSKVDNNEAWDRLKTAAVKTVGPELEHQLPAVQEDCAESESDCETTQGQRTSVSVSDQGEEGEESESDCETTQGQRTSVSVSDQGEEGEESESDCETTQGQRTSVSVSDQEEEGEEESGAVCATSAKVVMKSYSCCYSPLLESDVGNSDEESWAIGDTVIALYPGDQPCVPPCKNVSPGRLSLDGIGCPNVTLTAYYMGGEPDKIVDFIGQECPAPPEATEPPSDATRPQYGRSIIG